MLYNISSKKGDDCWNSVGCIGCASIVGGVSVIIGEFVSGIGGKNISACMDGEEGNVGVI